MSVRALPLVFINMGGEMLYILDQRLQVHNPAVDCSEKGVWSDHDRRRVLDTIIGTMFSRDFMDELFRPQQLYSHRTLKTVLTRLAHTSIMRLSPTSMDRLYELTAMAFKHQLLLCPRPKDLLLISYNHLDAIREFVADTPVLLNQVDETHRRVSEACVGALRVLQVRFQSCKRRKSADLWRRCKGAAWGRQGRPNQGGDALKERHRSHIQQGRRTSGSFDPEVYTSLSDAKVQLLRQTLLIFFQDMHVRVSFFLRDKVQNPNGRFVLSRSGPVPHGTEVPGLIRMLDSRGREVRRVHFPSGGSYSSPVKQGSFSLHGDRVTRLGTNIYCVNQPGETHQSSTAKGSTSPSPLAAEELNMLARLMGGVEVLQRPCADAGYRVNLFTMDPVDEEAEAWDSMGDVVTIQAVPDAQANGELARIAEEFTDRDHAPGERRSSRGSSKGDDLLALMDAC